MLSYEPLRDNVLVKKVEDKERKVITTINTGRWVRLEVIAVGPEVHEKIKPGQIVVAENMTEAIAGTDKMMILSKYIHAIEGKDLKYES